MTTMQKITPMRFQKTKRAGPRGLPLVGSLFQMRKDPLKFFTGISREYGDVVPVKIGFETIYLINHPDHLKRIFQDNRDNYVRSKYYAQLSPIIGDGLFTLEGKVWRRQRKAAQPAVSGPNLVNMTGVMVKVVREMIGRLRDYEKNDIPLEISKEAFHFKLTIVMRSLFNADLDRETFEKVLTALTIILKEIEKRVWEMFSPPLWLPSRRIRKLQEAIGTMGQIIDGIVENRLDSKVFHNDLLDMLIRAEKIYGWDQTSLRSIRDQVISIAIAGHETGAVALCWLTYELSKNPAIAGKIRQEADVVFGDKDPDFNSFQKLKYTHQVFKEILRLYPPLWTVSRQTVSADVLGQHKLPKGAIVMLSPYVMHRNPRFWNNPEVFDPDRFLPKQEATRHKHAYFPFGGGPHLCLGNRFGTLEGVMSLAMLCQKFDFEVCPGQKLEPVPMTTLRPSGRMFIKVRKGDETRRRLAA
ncbi:MAG: cytochrome P450 [Proteobacteria bacterium]|nr:cytochrome P450 [Pseudomonadota bacterium]